MKTSPLTFADYFKLNVDVEDVLADFQYSFRMKSCALPKQPQPEVSVEDVRRQLGKALPHVSLLSETARREFLIAPVLLEAAQQANAKIQVEFPVEVDDRLKGTLDYLVRTKHDVLVVEAKNGDLKRGFTQLAVELVAVDRWAVDSTERLLHGAVSTGDVWKFGILDREEKSVTEDIDVYGVPKDIEDVLAILAAILTA